jgi:hypothetical protein
LREYPLISAVDSEGDLASVLNRFFKQNEENGCLEPGQLSQENNKTPEIEDFEANSRRDVPNWADFERGMGQVFFFFFFVFTSYIPQRSICLECQILDIFPI